MRPQERFLAVIEDATPDYIPWAPIMNNWYTATKTLGAIPERFQKHSLKDIYRELDMCVEARAWDKEGERGRIYTRRYRNVEIKTSQNGEETITEYATPVGKVFTIKKSSQQLRQLGYADLLVSHMIKGPDDYPVVEYIIQNTEIVPTYDAYLAFESEIGMDGVPVIGIGQDPMSQILQNLIGYQTGYYHFYDHPKLFHHLYDVLVEHNQQIQAAALASPAKIMIHGAHFESRMTPPKIFKKYMLPYYQAFAERMRDHGKILACHADADTSNLLELILESGFRLLDCFITHPQVRVTMKEARNIFGDRVIIWGGVPAIILEDTYSEVEFESFMRQLFRDIAPGNAFIMGVSDEIMPESNFDRVIRIGEMIKEYGKLPIVQ